MCLVSIWCVFGEYLERVFREYLERVFGEYLVCVW